MSPEARPAVLERVIFFSDAVFAIAITLLVIELPAPIQSALGGDQSLVDALIGLSGRLFAFVIGFFVIGSYWVSHLRILRVAARVDLRLIWINLGFLFWIVAVPFVSDTLGANTASRGAVILFAAVQTAAGVFQLALWHYLTGHPELLAGALTPVHARSVTLQLVQAPAVFALSIVLALVVGAPIAAWSWVLIAVIGPVLARYFPLPEIRL